MERICPSAEAASSADVTSSGEVTSPGLNTAAAPSDFATASPSELGRSSITT
jgi:hypothetical protein